MPLRSLIDSTMKCVYMCFLLFYCNLPGQAFCFDKKQRMTWCDYFLLCEWIDCFKSVGAQNFNGIALHYSGVQLQVQLSPLYR